MEDSAIEKEIQDKGLDAPRVTLKGIEDKVQKTMYEQITGTTVTICALVMKNGFVVIGHSAAASPENFDEELGRKIARSKAIDNLWQLEGYLLREKLSENASA